MSSRLKYWSQFSKYCVLFITRATRTTRTPAFWDTPRCPMITHTSDSHQITSQNKTKSKLQILKKLPRIQILQETLHTKNLLKLLDKMHKYEMDSTRTVGATECTTMKWIQWVEDTQQTRFLPQMNRQTDKVKPVYHPFRLCWSKGYKKPLPTHTYVIHIMFHHCEYTRHCNQIWFPSSNNLVNLEPKAIEIISHKSYKYLMQIT